MINTIDNQNKEITWDKSHKNIFENFALDLQSFTNTGKYPDDADQDVKYGLELQLKRLKDRNLRIEYEIFPRGQWTDGGNLKRQWSDSKYISWREFCECGLYRTIYRSTTKVYHKYQKSTLYQIITNAKDKNTVAEELYSCPNCGAVSKIKVLQSGCPYCNTYFDMNDLFPKVTNYFFVKSDYYTEEEYRKSLIKVIVPIVALGMIFAIRDIAADEDIAFHIVDIIFGFIGVLFFGSFAGYFLWSMLKMFYVFWEGGKTIPMLVSSIGSGRRFVSFMSRYSPEFSYEYFSDKVVSLLKILIYSDHPNDLPYYEGIPIEDRFQNVIESAYSGIVALKRYRVKEDHCYVTVDVYLENLYDNGQRIYSKKDKVRVELCRNIHRPIDIHFSIERIQCKSCGASFNAVRMRNCPHCGNVYEMGDDDWIITKIR